MKKTITIRINKQLNMLCQVLEIKPEQVLQDFADNLSLHHQYTSGSDERRMAVEYFMRVGYGTGAIDFDELEHMFDQLETLRWAFYNFGNDRHEEYLAYRNNELAKLQRAWLKKVQKVKQEYMKNNP